MREIDLVILDVSKKPTVVRLENSQLLYSTPFQNVHAEITQYTRGKKGIGERVTRNGIVKIRIFSKVDDDVGT